MQHDDAVVGLRLVAPSIVLCVLPLRGDDRRHAGFVLAGHPGAVAQLIEDIEAHHEADKRWRENQKLGKIVEDLIGARLKSRLSLSRIRVKPQFKGYDLGAYVDDASYADVGWIDVQQGEMLIAKIEIFDSQRSMDDFERTVRGLHVDGKIDQATLKVLLATYEKQKEQDHASPPTVPAGPRSHGSNTARRE